MGHAKKYAIRIGLWEIAGNLNWVQGANFTHFSYVLVRTNYKLFLHWQAFPEWKSRALHTILQFGVYQRVRGGAQKGRLQSASNKEGRTRLVTKRNANGILSNNRTRLRLQRENILRQNDARLSIQFRRTSGQHK